MTPQEEQQQAQELLQLQAEAEKARIEEEERKKEEEEKAKKEKEKRTGNAATRAFLRRGWMCMCSVVGFIPGVIWVDFCIFCKAVFGERLFPRLGDEWPMLISSSQRRKIGLYEAIGIALINLAMLLLIMAVAFIVVYISQSLSLEKNKTPIEKTVPQATTKGL